MPQLLRGERNSSRDHARPNRHLQSHPAINQGPFTTAFRTDSPAFEAERRTLLDTPGVLFQEAYVEPLPEYASGKRLDALGEEELVGMSGRARSAFAAIAGAGLFRSGHALYLHQQEMLTEALAGKHCVVVTGTGSGKTEAFLLPVLATIVREAIDDQGGELRQAVNRRGP